MISARLPAISLLPPLKYVNYSTQIIALLDGLGGLEMLVIFVLSLMLFGGKRLPEVAKGLGKSVREFKRAASGVEDEIRRAMDLDSSPHRRPPIRRSRPAITEGDSASKALPAAGTAAAAASTSSGVSETGEPLDQDDYDHHHHDYDDHHHDDYDYDEDHRHLETTSETEPEVNEAFEAGLDTESDEETSPDSPEKKA